MKKNLAKIATGAGAALSTFYWVTLPALAAPDGTTALCPPSDQLQPPGCEGGKVVATVDLAKIVSFVINILLFVAFVAALVFLIIGGIKWIMSGGDKEGTTKAKETVTSALIGLAVVLAAWILINLVLSLFGIPGGIGALKVPVLGTVIK